MGMGLTVPTKHIMTALYFCAASVFSFGALCSVRSEAKTDK